MRQDSIAVHSGLSAVTAPVHPLSPPIYQSSVFLFDDLQTAGDVTSGTAPGYSYGRIGNPNADMFSRAVADLEGAEAGATAASGTGAILAGIVALRRSGPVAIAEELYGGTYALCRDFLAPLGVPFVRFDAHRPDEIPEDAGVVLVESVANPLGRLSDLERIAEVTHGLGARLLVDSTFATPALVQPLRHGADLVVHSATKFLSGHGDVLLGVLGGGKEEVARAQSALVTFGATPDPFAAWLALRGLRTFSVRMDRAVRNAAALADYLAGRKEVVRVHHASREDHPDRALAVRYLGGQGPAILAFDLKDLDAASRFVARTRLIRYAPSLGDVATIMLHPATTSHRALPEEEKQRLGITPGTIRLSVGIEAVEDLIADIDGALS